MSKRGKMFLSALSSGSCGNCFYFESHGTAFLIDAGLSCKQIVERIERIGRDARMIKALFITHEHVDHVRGADIFSKRFGVPIFATQKTAEACGFGENDCLVNHIENNECIELGKNIRVSAFSKSHDCSDPVSFNVSMEGKEIGVCTDIGYACSNVINAINSSNFLIMESNYDVNMLKKGPYPGFLKERISGEKGHLSNFESAVSVLEHASSKLKGVMLSHLSDVNNNPYMAFNTFSSIIKERRDLKPSLLVSERNICTGLIGI